MVDAGYVAGLSAKTGNVDVFQINQPSYLRLFEQTPDQVNKSGHNFKNVEYINVSVDCWYGLSTRIQLRELSSEVK